MNTIDTTQINQSETGEKLTTNSADIGAGSVNCESDEMKRAIAKKLIERYFYQLSDGCGNPKCGNKNCASSGGVETLSPNQAAARAIQLYTQEAELCELHPSKVARTQLDCISPHMGDATTRYEFFFVWK